jgi:uncharacterized membrane protein
MRVTARIVTVRIVLALAILATLLSYFKFNHCEDNNFAGPDQYIHACYSDLPALFSERAFGQGQWAFSGGDQAAEYPALQGMVMWATAQISSDSPITYFRINIFLIALLFIASAFILYRIRPELSYLYAIVPTGIAALFINWDLWAIVTMLLSIYWFDRKRETLSAVTLAISIATKFFPIVLLLPIAIIFLRRQDIRGAIKYIALTLAIFIAINIPFALTTPQGWWRFYELNLERKADWGSLWYALSVLGLNLAAINYLSILTLLIVVTAISIFLLQVERTLPLSESALYIFIGVMAVSKVYSPQFVLWLAPLVILALRDKRDLPWFWGWQIAEIGYHIAIWQHLALLTGATYGLSVKAYAVFILIRIAASIALAIALARRHKRRDQPWAAEFLISSASSYP